MELVSASLPELEKVAEMDLIAWVSRKAEAELPYPVSRAVDPLLKPEDSVSCWYLWNSIEPRDYERCFARPSSPSFELIDDLWRKCVQGVELLSTFPAPNHVIVPVPRDGLCEIYEELSWSRRTLARSKVRRQVWGSRWD